jgi:hypothetical protein
MAKPTGADVTFRRSSFYFLQCGGLERQIEHLNTTLHILPLVRVLYLELEVRVRVRIRADVEWV